MFLLSRIFENERNLLADILDVRWNYNKFLYFHALLPYFGES